MRQKSKKWVSAGEALKGAAKRIGIAKQMRRYEVLNLWDSIAGPAIAAHATPSKWQGTTLVVAVEHSSWMQELSYLKSELLSKTREAIPDIDIKDIRFEIGHKEKAKTPISKSLLSDPSPLTRDETEFIEQAAGELKSDDAKAALRRLMTLDFQQKKRTR